jgi:hypothetical protein
MGVSWSMWVLFRRHDIGDAVVSDLRSESKGRGKQNTS